MSKTVYKIYCSGKLICTIEDIKDVDPIVQVILNEHLNDDNIAIKRTFIDTEGNEL